MTTVPRPARPSRAAEAQEGVKDLIVRRGLVAGDPLLQAVGIVDIRHGFGMFVGRMSLAGLVNELTFHSRITLQNGANHLAHLIEIREILESGLVERLIELGPEVDLAPVAAVMARMETEAEAGPVSPETDRLFHDLLYRPLGNPLVSQLLGAFWDVYYQLRDALGAPDEPSADVAKRHRDIYTAVLAGDRAAAVAAVHAHFEGVRNRVAKIKT